MVPQVELFLFVFFYKELKTPKRHFEINGPLVVIYGQWHPMDVNLFLSCFLPIYIVALFMYATYKYIRYVDSSGRVCQFFLVLALNIHTMYTINNVHSTGKYGS